MFNKLFKFAPDEPPTGGTPAATPAGAQNAQVGASEPQKVANNPSPAPDIAKLTEQIRQQVLAEIEAQKQKDAKLAELSEIEKLKAKNAELEASLVAANEKQKKDAYEAELKSLAAAAGASKLEAVVKLADSGKAPADAVSELKRGYPELFVKAPAPTINSLGGGATGTPGFGDKTPEDVGKLSMADFIKWRNADKK